MSIPAGDKHNLHFWRYGILKSVNALLKKGNKMQAFFERMLETHGKSFAVAFGMGLLIALLVLTPTAGAQPSQAVDRAERLQAQAEQ